MGQFILTARQAARCLIVIDNAELTRLMKRLSERQDQDAFNMLFDYYSPRIRSVMIKQGCSGELADEIAQETLLKVWRKAAMFNPDKGSVASWVFTIARNLKIDRFRKELPWQKLPEDFDQIPSDCQQADEIVSENQRRDQLLLVLETLPKEQRQIVTMSFLEGQSHGEIAKTLDLPLGTVKSRMRLAATKIKKAMKEKI